MTIDWGGLVGVVAGGLIAAGAGLLQGLQSQKAAREQFAAERAAMREEEIRQRAEAKASEILSALDQMSGVLFHLPNGRQDLFPDDPASRKLALDNLATIEAAAVYLPRPLRQRVMDSVLLLRGIDSMSGRHFISDPPLAAGGRVIRYTREAVARQLRGEDPLERPERIEQYLRGLAEFDDYVQQLADPGGAGAGAGAV